WVEGTEERWVIETYRDTDGPWLTLGADPAHQVTVSWLTEREQPTMLSFGPDEQSLVAWPTPTGDRHLHQVVLDGLQPGTRYCYDIDAAFESGVTGPFCFTTVDDRTDATLRIGVIGDMQPSSPALVASNRYMATQIAGVDVDLWVQVGDISHWGDDLDRWHELFLSLPIFASQTPLVATIGNHDTYGDSGRNWRSLFPHPFVSDTAHYY